jgi:hypothetical protein
VKSQEVTGGHHGNVDQEWDGHSDRIYPRIVALLRVFIPFDAVWHGDPVRRNIVCWRKTRAGAFIFILLDIIRLIVDNTSVQS